MNLDPNNKEFNLAVELVRDTSYNLFLTGKAGTGKTTFLRYIKDAIEKPMAVVAPTGVAAINAGGVTIHSLFQIKPSVYPPTDPRLRRSTRGDSTDKSTIYSHFRLSDEKKEVLQKIEVLVIDEISMVRCDLLDVVDRLLRVFGGGKAEIKFERMEKEINQFLDEIKTAEALEKILSAFRKSPEYVPRLTPAMEKVRQQYLMLASEKAELEEVLEEKMAALEALRGQRDRLSGEIEKWKKSQEIVENELSRLRRRKWWQVLLERWKEWFGGGGGESLG